MFFGDFSLKSKLFIILVSKTWKLYTRIRTWLYTHGIPVYELIYRYTPFCVIYRYCIIFLWGAWNGGDSESPDFLHQISIYTDIIESPNLQYLNMQIIKSPGSKWKNPHPHFFQNPQISRF